MRKFSEEDIYISISTALKHTKLFGEYELVKTEFNSVRSPSIYSNYDMTFNAPSINRWVFVRLEDHFKFQKLVIYINHLINPKPTNLDLEKYFYRNLKKHSIGQKMTFKINSIDDLNTSISQALEFIYANIDTLLKDVLLGKAWIDMPFDWEPYK